MPFPGWGEFEGPDSADLDDAAKQAIASAAIPVPEGVIRGVIRLADERRYDVPVVLICPEFSPAQAREWIDQGEVPELAKSKDVSFVDIDSGHWPMISAPAELARLLAQAAGGRDRAACTREDGPCRTRSGRSSITWAGSPSSSSATTGFSAAAGAWATTPSVPDGRGA